MNNTSVKEQYFVTSIELYQTHEWILKKHYAKRMPSISYAFGLYEGPILIGIMTIGKPASPNLCDSVCGKENSQYVYELNRLCVNEGLRKNVLSYFVASALRLIKESLIIVSYADTSMGHAGYIYQATNWIYTGATKERTDIGFEDGSHSRHYEKGIDYNINRKHRSSKHRYIYFVGSMRNIFLKKMKYKKKPYPKTENKRYDASYMPKVQMMLFK